MEIISPTRKIFSDAKSFSNLRDELRSDEKKLVFTNGCFDILHRGHCEYLFRARQLGNFLIVGLNTDDSVRRLKGDSKPFQPLEDRAFVLASLSFVDAVIPFAENTPLELILSLRPDILVKGADYEISDIVGANEVLTWGGKVERIPFIEGKSTTAIIEKIRNANIKH